MIMIRLEVRLPRTWLSLVEEIAWNYDEETVDTMMGKSLKEAQTAVMNSAGAINNQLDGIRLDELNTLHATGDVDIPDTTIAFDLLSPVPSRDPSPRRLREKSHSPARWKILRSINDAIQDVMNRKAPGVYGKPFSSFWSIASLTQILLVVPTPTDSRPGRFVRHLDFNHFRTIGMRRSVEEGVNSRFVTGDRVQAVLKVRRKAFWH